MYTQTHTSALRKSTTASSIAVSFFKKWKMMDRKNSS